MLPSCVVVVKRFMLPVVTNIIYGFNLSKEGVMLENGVVVGKESAVWQIIEIYASH